MRRWAVLVGEIDAGVIGASLRLLPESLKLAGIPKDDIVARRDTSGPIDAFLAERFYPSPGVAHRDEWIDDGRLRLRVYTPAPMPSRGVLYYIHGGGLILSHIDAYDARCSYWASHTGCTVVSVDYRLAPENPYPAAIDDCMTGLIWTHEHLSDYDATTLGVAGDSAGGGLAAATALRNRDLTHLDLACQVLIYPMLDDRNIHADERFASRLVPWTFEDNSIGWNAYLQGQAGAPGISAYAAPARADSLAGLPPTYIDTGSMDIFLDEDVAYARRLIDEGVPVEAHIWNGALHGFDYIAPRIALSRTAWDKRIAFVRSHL